MVEVRLLLEIHILPECKRRCAVDGGDNVFEHGAWARAVPTSASERRRLVGPQW